MPSLVRVCIASLIVLTASATQATGLKGMNQQAAGAAATQNPGAHKLIPIEQFLRQDGFDEIKLSPTGEYIARTVPLGEKVVLAISRRGDPKIIGHFNLGGKTQVRDFWWVNDKRLLISVGEKFGELEKPMPTGELYATNADGSGQDLLVGQRAEPEARSTHIVTGKKQELVGADFLSLIPNKPDKVLISVHDLQGSESSYTLTQSSYSRVEEMDVNSGHRMPVVHAPVHTADFTVDPQGVVRFAYGSDSDNVLKTYYRDNAKSDWQLLNDEGVTQLKLIPLGFSADGTTAYLRRDEKEGPDAVFAYDTASHTMRLQQRDPISDPVGLLFGPNQNLIGVQYYNGKPKLVFFDEKSQFAQLYRSLEASFPGQAVVFDDFTSSAKLATVVVYSDRSPGDYYVFDLEKKKAEHLISRYDWLDPDQMGETRPVTLTARDGLVLHGFLTLPNGSDGMNLPLVVNPHGGPFGEFDVWGFDREVQLLASRGYAVLQVNYRGSGNYGLAFQHAGYKQWGGKMQDDLTDATRWAIQQGIANPRRICIYGASYGGYAALMGVAKEPSLYRCAIGYVGVYDLPTMYRSGDIKDSLASTNELKDTLGEDNLEGLSPTHLADRITVPVMLVAGREDVRAPPIHTEMMRDALQRAGKSVDAKIYDKEGHGFFIEADKLDFYTRMLAFLDRNIGDHGGSTPVAASVQSDSKH